MARWSFTKSEAVGGEFRLWASRLGPGGASVDVSRFRSAPTVLDSYSSADPFGDSSAVFTFPAITPFDDFDSADLSPWLAQYSNVDLWWIWGIPDDGHYGTDAHPDRLRTNPLTQRRDWVSPGILYDAGGARPWNRVKIWEGYIADLSWVDQGESTALQVQCQGALFQLDRYLQKPFFPERPWPLEGLIAEVFAHARRPQLRTQNLLVSFPAGWTKKVPRYKGSEANVYAPVARPGTKWTGLTSRATGSWEHALTGFVQNTLTDMIVDGESGVVPGNQWTVLQNRATAANPRGRQPVLKVRDRFRPPDFAVWVGAPGVKLRLGSDSTQSENAIYGEGTDINGELWRNAVISNDGSRTDYLPLAAAREIWPPGSKQSTAHRGTFVSEAYTQFGPGFSQVMATTVSEQLLARNQQPGWSGTITLTADPSLSLPRWLIRAGMTLLLKGYQGTGEAGMPFHVSAVEADPMSGTVQLTVDTRYRDLLTVAESIARTRDPLTPVRALQVNKTSVLIEDIQAPWDYSAGSGFIPRASTAFYRHKPVAQPFPWVQWARDHPPLHFPSWYIRCNAAAGYLGSNTWDTAHRHARWAVANGYAIPILTAEKGTIARSEFFCVDAYGRPAKVPFHVSIYYVPVTPGDMPRDAHGPSPYIDGAFESVNPATGQAWPAGNFLAPQDKFIIGWGNRSNGIFNRAGFSPGSEAEGGTPTGLLFDDANWDFDNTQNPNYDKLAKPGMRNQQQGVLDLYVMFYCEATHPVFFGGRLYRQNPGVS